MICNVHLIPFPLLGEKRQAKKKKSMSVCGYGALAVLAAAGVAGYDS